MDMLVRILLFTTISSGHLAAEYFSISRIPQQNGDRFEIHVPNSTCEGNTSASKCEEYGSAQNGSLCSCQCPSARASLLFNGTKWKCTDDRRIRVEESKCLEAI